MKTVSLLKKIGVIIAVAVFWLAAWQIAAHFVDNALLLPFPREVMSALGRVITASDFGVTLMSSVGGVFKGFFAGQLAGLALAIFTVNIKFAKALLAPLMGVVKATPIASFIILVLVWIGKEDTPAFISFLIVLPVVWENVQTGIVRADKKLLEAAAVYKFGIVKKIKYVFLPAVMPYFVSAFKISLGMAWKAGVAAEVLCATRATLGGEIYDAKIYLEISDLFAWTIIVILISMVLEFVLVRLLNLLSRKLSLTQEGKNDD